MKLILNVIWQFFVIIGEHRYQMSKCRGYGMYRSVSIFDKKSQ